MSLTKRFSKPIYTVYVGGFIFALHLAFTMYINSSFLSEAFGEQMVGMLFTIGAILAILGLSQLPHILQAFGAKRVLGAGLITSALLLLGLGSTESQLLIGVFFTGYFALNTLVLFGIDVMIEDLSDEKTMGQSRGVYLTLKHGALMVAPLATGFLIDASSFSLVYAIAAILILLSLYTLTQHLTQFKEPKYIEQPLFNTVKKFMTTKELRFIFVANFLLHFFYAWMVIYIPIHLIQNIGMPWSEVGILITIMMAAFVILEYPLGWLADTYGYLKVWMTLGFVIMAGSASIIPFIEENTFLLWAFVLFLTRVGASAVEVMTETYFFKKVHRDDISSISLFRDTFPLAYILGPLIASVFLGFIPMHYLFIILGIVMLYGIRYSIGLYNHPLNNTIHDDQQTHTNK